MTSEEGPKVWGGQSGDMKNMEIEGNRAEGKSLRKSLRFHKRETQGDSLMQRFYP